MGDLIDQFASYPSITALCMGLLLLIGAITKGGINLGFVEIPKMSVKQSVLLASLGAMMIVGAAVYAIKPWEHNHPPEVVDTYHELHCGDTLSLDVLAAAKDEDGDELMLSILAKPKLGKFSSTSSVVNYTPNAVGLHTVVYQVSDGHSGYDTASLFITVDPILIDCRGALVDVFGRPKSGVYEIGSPELRDSSEVVIDTKGQFDMLVEKRSAQYELLVEGDGLPFTINPNQYKARQVLEYDPIDSVQITFCKSYYRDNKTQRPVGVFENYFKIPFDSLECSKEPNANGDSLLYGKLYCAFRFFGSDLPIYSGKSTTRDLNFRFIQTDGERQVYDSIFVSAGTSSGGWRTHLNKKLLKGQYKLQVVSGEGEVIAGDEFWIE